MNTIKTYNFNVSSSQRLGTTSTPSNFTLKNSNNISLSRSDAFFRFRLNSCCIPFSFHQLNSTNNTLTFSITRSGVTQSSTIQLIPGNYNINTLLVHLDNKLTAAIDVLIPGWSLANVRDLIFSYDKDTMFTTFSVLDTIPVSITLQFSSNKVLGRFFGSPNNITFTDSASTLSTQPVNVSPARSIYLRSDTLTQSQNWEALIEEMTTSDILAEIPIMNAPTSYIQFSSNGTNWITLSNQVISDLQFNLTDSQSYEPIDLLNELTLNFTIEECLIVRFEPQQNLLNPIPQQVKTLSPLPTETPTTPNETGNNPEARKLLDEILKVKEKLKRVNK